MARLIHRQQATLQHLSQFQKFNNSLSKSVPRRLLYCAAEQIQGFGENVNRESAASKRKEPEVERCGFTGFFSKAS